jgi:hypothetical protein
VKKFIVILFFVSNHSFLFSQAFSWAKKFGDTGYENLSSLVADGLGNVYSTGGFQNTVDFDPGPGTFTLSTTNGPGMFLLKLDAAGNFLWVKQIGGFSIKLDALGNIYIAGSFQGTVDFDPGVGTFNLTSAGNTDIFVCKLDAGGNFIWAKNMGGTNAEYAYEIAVDASYNVYTTGYFTSFFADFDPGSGSYYLFPNGLSDIFVSKLDASGNFLWAKQIGGSNLDLGGSIAVDGVGNAIVVGTFSSTVIDFDPGPGSYTLSNNGGMDFFIEKLDPAGNFSWAKAIGGATDDAAISVFADLSGYIYTTGYFSGSNVNFDPISGTFSMSSFGGNDVFISKYDPSGNFIFAKQLGGSLNDIGQSVFADGTGHIYLTGSFEGTCDFDPGSSTVNSVSNGLSDVFINILDPAGNFYWSGQLGGPNNDIGYSLAATPIGEIYTGGDFYSNIADFDCGIGTYTLGSAGNSDAFIHKITGAPSFINQKTSNENFLVFPQPAKDKLYFKIKNQVKALNFKTINGQEIPVQQDTNGIDVSGISDGIYLLQIQTKESVLTRKVVIQK